jgi:hypothetical protein
LAHAGQSTVPTEPGVAERRPRAVVSEDPDMKARR